jgi:NADH:ubiquinone oxidoreductase subunit 2 (subunit N)
VIGRLFFAWGTVLSEYYILAVIGLLLKIGASPLFWWVPPLISRLDWFSIGLLSTIQKIPGLVLFRMIYDLKVEISIFLSFLGFFIASVGIKVSFKNLKNLLGWSSVRNMRILFLIFVLKSRMGILYYLFYRVLVLIFCLGMSFIDSNILCKNFLKGQKLKTKFFIRFILLVFSGLPPFIRFLLKVYFFSSFYLLDSCYILVELDLKGNFLSYFYLLGSFLQRWKIILIFIFLIILQSVGYIKAFINVKVKSLSRRCSAASYIKKSIFFLLLLFLLVYLLRVRFIWF